jgi:hypothetical protein
MSAQYILTLFAFASIILGLLEQHRPFIESSIKSTNSFKKVKIKITKESIAKYKTSGVLLIIIGIIYLFVATLIPF